MSYSTLLGSYRMSASSQVLPPASSKQHQQASDVYRYPAAATTHQQQGYQAASSSSGSLQDTARRYADGSYSSNSQQQHYQGSTTNIARASAVSNNTSMNYGNSNSAVSRPRSSASFTKQASSTSPSTVPQSYLSTSNNSSSSASNPHYYYQQQQQQTQKAAAPVPSSSSSSSSILTQAQRTSGGSTSSKNSNVINNAHHHRLRSSMYKPKWDPALPSRTRYSHRPLLLLDLDETLVHATTQRPHPGSNSHNGPHDFHFTVDMGPHQAPVPVWVAVRPGAMQFVEDVAAFFEIGVFTASIKNYADKVCEALDPSGTLIHHRLYRDHCSDVDGVFVKDLSLLNRPLHRVSILDNSPHAYLFHPENSIPILSWFDDKHDNELQKMTPMLIHRLAQSNECYDVLDQYRNSL